MSLIQKIRDKYATMTVVVICLAIVGFLLQDAFFGKGSLMGSSTSVGEVNGKELDIAQYNNMIDIAERNQAAQYQLDMDESMRQSIREQVWQQFINQQILSEEYEKLGIVVTDEEVTDQFLGNNPNPQIVQMFTDPKTGVFNREMMIQAIQSGQYSQDFLNLEQGIKQQQYTTKYLALVTKAINYPKWMQELQVKDGEKAANISYIQVPYASIADSTIKLTDAELNDYIQKHKDLFPAEESRRVEFISFDAIPSAKDTTAVLESLANLKSAMDSLSNDDIPTFINANSDNKYFDAYVPLSIIRVPEIDSIKALSIGQTYGPYFDGGLITYAKMVDRKTLPDTVEVRYIAMSSQPAIDSAVKARIDSISTVIKNGGDFAALASEFSEDNSTAQNGGKFTVTPAGNFFEEGKDFALNGKKNELKVIKTNFGYLLMQIMEQKNFGTALKVAYLSKKVEPSQETSRAAYAKASDFASKNRDRKTFDNTIREEGLNKGISEDIRPMDFVIPGVGSARDLVRWAYSANIGDVSGVFTVDYKNVVAVLTNVTDKGTLSLNEVRPRVEAEVRKIKKADQIISKLKNPATIEAAAEATSQPIQKTEGVTFTMPSIASIGYEPRIAGAAFNKNWGVGKVSAAIEGNTGVFVIKVDEYVGSEQPKPEYENQRKIYEQSLSNFWMNQLSEVFRKKADVEDNRAKFF
ncbi:hypothetical protein COR50_05245 [Chitinophaga caeni]|uniref:Periplasmic chaperone PpiD n=1 Tax=Chitinophaga caeni TaxID=2029983 RepID=A0A291QRT9_9BACT|nr:peptidylprolyl isomerase [Chitinophaga caeni]ATL46635.1 hypothetical protein COR50_05245 [Chitinophaga caeni]